jgi:hypothetical protein
MRLIIPCAGEQTRWQNHLDVPKYMAPVFGEPLLCRTVRKFRERCPDLTVIVLLHPDRPKPTLPDDVIFYRPYGDQLGQHYKLLSSLPCWAPIERTFILFGDVFMSNETIDAFLATRTGGLICQQTVQWFGRSGDGVVTGCKRQEIFGLTFPANQSQQLARAAMLAMSDMYRGGTTRSKAWETYRRLVGLPKNGEWPGPNFHELADISEDFDTPGDYRGWLDAVERTHYVD